MYSIYLKGFSMERLIAQYDEIINKTKLENEILEEREQCELRLDRINKEYVSIRSKTLSDRIYNSIIIMLGNYINSKKGLQDFADFHTEFIAIDALQVFRCIDKIDGEKLKELLEIIEESINNIVPDSFISMSKTSTEYEVQYILPELGSVQKTISNIQKIIDFCKIMRILELMDRYIVAQYIFNNGTYDMYLDNRFGDFKYND